MIFTYICCPLKNITFLGAGVLDRSRLIQVRRRELNRAGGRKIMKEGHEVTEYVPGDLLFVQREKEKRGPCPNLLSRNNSYPQHHFIFANFDAPLGSVLDNRINS